MATGAGAARLREQELSADRSHLKGTIWSVTKGDVQHSPLAYIHVHPLACIYTRAPNTQVTKNQKGTADIQLLN